MDDKKIEELWRMLDTRITTINERTKGHTLEIRDLKKQIKEILEKLENEK